MSQPLADKPSATPDSWPVEVLLGLKEGEPGTLARLRGLQLSYLSTMVIGRIVAHAMGGLMVIGLFHDHVPAALLIGWLALLTVILYSSIRVDHRMADADRRPVQEGEFRGHIVNAALTAFVWSIPLLIFAPLGDTAHHLSLWTLVAMLIAGAALWLSPAPLGTLIFLLGAGAAAVVSFAIAGQYDIAVVIAAYLAVAAAGTLKGARTFLAARLAEAGVAEKSEVVSLLLREFEENQADWLWETDTLRRACRVSPRFAYALGCDPDQANGAPLLQLIAGESWQTGNFAPSLHDLANRLKHRESFSNLIVRVHIGNDERWWELSGTPRLDEQGRFQGFRGVGSDITEARESSEKIARMARYDALTALPNRLMLMETLGDAMRWASEWRSRCAFLMIDLDRFKAVNDSLGHMVGDKLLEEVSQRLKAIMSENELCGRLGGDEFAIVIRDASDRERVSQVAQAVIRQLSEPYEVDQHTLYVGSSVGSAIGPRDGGTVEELIRNADLALYRAKDEGGGTHCEFEPALHAAAEERRKLEFSLRRALDQGEMSLNYQPVVDARSEEVVSFEALLRWNSKEHGPISPAKFVPLAEDTRLIVPIGEWVLHEACREAAKWPGSTKVAVNVSGEQLLDRHFARTVVSALAASRLDPVRLEIEVTESIFVRDDVTACKTLEHIMSMGCTVALDDFGTGYSSLGYLRRLRFSTIKVDRMFVQGAAQGNSESLAIIRAVVAMADSLKMSTTAEGVETAAEAAMIRDLGCTRIQGFHFGRPMVAADARKLFERVEQRKRA